ncbi:MAG: lytic transglycosylase domain-containing protein, partial [Myxococcota bacterium]
ESYFDHLAVSPVGAEGLMQLMPATAEWMAERVDVEWPDGNSFDPEVNVTLGIRYFGFLYSRFHRFDHALTAYNRGPAATRYILGTHGRLPHEIHDFYAGKVLDRYRSLLYRYGEVPNSWGRAS